MKWISYTTLMCAYVLDLMAIGTIGLRGRIVLCMAVVGMAFGAVQTIAFGQAAGLVGVAGAAASVLFVRHAVPWYFVGGGYQLVSAWWFERAAPPLMDFAYDCAIRIGEVFRSPTPHEALPASVRPALPVAPVSRTIVVAQGSREALLSAEQLGLAPGDKVQQVSQEQYDRMTRVRFETGVAPVADAADTAPIDLQDTMELASVPTLALVETFADWLPTAVETCGGKEKAVQEGMRRWGFSRRTMYRRFDDFEAAQGREAVASA